MQRVHIHLIKQRQVYSIVEIMELLGVHKNTVRQWILAGLDVIDDARPILIHGSALKSFLQKRRAAAKSPCNLHEFYCLKCRAPRSAWGSLADIVVRSQNLFHLQAVCDVCGTAVHKTANQKKLLQLLETFTIQQVRPTRIIETLPPSLKCYFGEDADA